MFLEFDEKYLFRYSLFIVYNNFIFSFWIILYLCYFDEDIISGDILLLSFFHKGYFDMELKKL